MRPVATSSVGAWWAIFSARWPAGRLRRRSQRLIHFCGQDASSTRSSTPPMSTTTALIVIRSGAGPRVAWAHDAGDRSGGAQLVAGVPLRRNDAQDLVLVRRAEKTPRLTDDLLQLLARSVRELSREAIGDLLDGRDCLHDRFFGRFRGSGSADRSSYPGSLPDRGSGVTS